LATAIDLAGGTSLDDDAVGTLLWLPMHEALDRDDSLFRRTARAIRATEAPSEAPRPLLPLIAGLLGPEAQEVVGWLRRAPLDNGIAAELVDGEGRAVGNGGDAALAGLLAHTIWYASHALGVRE
jgi:hypothetical protein